MNCHTFSAAFAKKMSQLTRQKQELEFIGMLGNQPTCILFFKLLECWNIFEKNNWSAFGRPKFLRLNLARLMGSIPGLVYWV